MSYQQGSDLVEFVSSLGGGDGLRVEETLGNGYVRLRISEAERRQALHDIRSVEDAVIELLRNSRDAGATRIFVASSREEDLRTITILDDGSGVPPSMHSKIFDARVTSKLDTVHMDRWGIHGRGMALYSIQHNAQTARIVSSDVGLGTSLEAVFNTNSVTERADQSTWPTVGKTKSPSDVRGPNNIARACVEFALESHGTCNVYLGSPSEIVATMRKRVEVPLELVGKYSAPHLDGVPLTMRPSFAQDAKQLRLVAESLGLCMSERTAHRIIRGQIVPLQNVLVRASGGSGSPTPAVRNTRQSRRLILANADKEEFLEEVSDAFQRMANRYYFHIEGTPQIRIDSGSVHVSFAYGEDED